MADPRKCVKCGAQDGSCPSCGQDKPKLVELDVFGAKQILCPPCKAEWEKVNQERRASWQRELAMEFFPKGEAK